MTVLMVGGLHAVRDDLNGPVIVRTRRMRILGLDVGTKRIGVAVSDPLGMTAQGVTVLERHGSRVDLNAVCALVTEYRAERIVIGLPLSLHGERGPQAKAVEAFALALQRRSATPVELVDERFTTVQSERMLVEGDVSRRRRKQVVDQVAAQLILQHFLEMKRPSDESS